MNENEDIVVDKQKMLKLRTFYFNRYLIVRYIMALFLFLNINWFTLLVYVKSYFSVIPLFLMCCSIYPIYEQIKLYRTPTNKLPYTKIYFNIQIMMNVLLMMLSVTSIFDHLYYFIDPGYLGHSIILLFLLLGIFIGEFTVRRLKKIENNLDKYYNHLKKYKQIIDL